jgi:hypothetical protein
MKSSQADASDGRSRTAGAPEPQWTGSSTRIPGASGAQAAERSRHALISA